VAADNRYIADVRPRAALSGFEKMIEKENWVYGTPSKPLGAALIYFSGDGSVAAFVEENGQRMLHGLEHDTLAELVAEGAGGEYDVIRLDDSNSHDPESIEFLLVAAASMYIGMFYTPSKSTTVETQSVSERHQP